MKYIFLLFLFFASFHSIAQNFSWVATGISATEDVEGVDIITLSNGGYLAGGIFEGTAIFGNTTISSLGDKDFFLCRYDDFGTLQWVKSYGGTDDVEITGVAVGPNNTFYIAGTFKGLATIGTSTLTNISDDNGFVARLDNQGTPLWVLNINGTDDVKLADIAVDMNTGSAYIVGQFEGTATLGTIATSTAGEGILIAAIDSSGTTQWAAQASSADEAKASSLTLGGGNIYLTGEFEDALTFGTTTLPNASGADMFVASCSAANGIFNWANGIGGTDDVDGKSIIVDNMGNTYVTGIFEGSVFLDSTLISSGDKDAFLVKYSSSGIETWAKQFSSTNKVSAGGLHLDASGNIWVTGQIAATTTFDNITVTNNSGSDFFITKFNAAGTAQLAKSVGGTSAVGGLATTTDSLGNPVVIGSFDGTAYFDAITTTGTTNDGFFIGKIVNTMTTTNLLVEENSVKVYPNPVKENLILELEEIPNRQLWHITTITGQQIQSLRCSNKINLIDLHNLPNGVYFLSDGLRQLKFVKL